MNKKKIYTILLFVVISTFVLYNAYHIYNSGITPNKIEESIIKFAKTEIENPLYDKLENNKISNDVLKEYPFKESIAYYEEDNKYWKHIYNDTHNTKIEITYSEYLNEIN